MSGRSLSINSDFSGDQTNQGKKGIEDAIELLSKVPKGLPPLKYSKAMEEATK